MISRKCSKQNDPKERMTKPNRCRRLPESQNAPNSGTQKQGNKGLCNLLQQEVKAGRRGTSFYNEVSKKASTPPTSILPYNIQ
jgi:hypothetical protein